MAVEAGHVTPALGEASSGGGGASFSLPATLGDATDDTNKQLLVKSASDGSTTGNDPGQFIAEHIQPDGEGWRLYHNDWCIAAWTTADHGATWTKADLYYYAKSHIFDAPMTATRLDVTFGDVDYNTYPAKDANSGRPPHMSLQWRDGIGYTQMLQIDQSSISAWGRNADADPWYTDQLVLNGGAISMSIEGSQAVLLQPHAVTIQCLKTGGGLVSLQANGARWSISDSVTASRTVHGSLHGDTATRTGATASLDVTDTGACWFDTDLGKPIWWSGSAWVDATGTAV